MKRFPIGFVIILLIGIATGCGFAVFFLNPIVRFLNPSVPGNSYGRFIGSLNPTWLDDGRTMKLNSDFAYVDPNSKAWVAPQDSEVDGASIPRALWTAVGAPFTGKYRMASVVHDVACVERKESSEDVHRMFYFACRCAGVEEAQAKMLYLGVWLGGPKWKVAYETKMVDGIPIRTSKSVELFEAKPLTDAEVQAIAQYIETHSPDLAEIEKLELIDGEIESKEADEVDDVPPVSE